MDNRTDARSYEYYTHNRPEHYYGALHWSHAWPVLVDRVGVSAPDGYSFARTNVNGAVTDP